MDATLFLHDFLSKFSTSFFSLLSTFFHSKINKNQVREPTSKKNRFGTYFFTFFLDFGLSLGGPGAFIFSSKPFSNRFQGSETFLGPSKNEQNTKKLPGAHQDIDFYRACARRESCRRIVAAVGVIWKLRSTFRPGNYIWSCSYGFGVIVRDIENADWGSEQDFDANLMSIVVWPGEPF